MHLLRKMVMSSHERRKEKTTTNIVNKNQDNQHEAFEDEVWQKIVAALAARGYPPAKKDVETRKR
jgi:hypothetical protein